MFTTTLTSSINHADIQFGKGGFGVVYHGIWRHNDVAIKQLLIDKVSPESALEFQTESQVMAGLRSPNIVQFYGFCMSPNYCIVMEYMPNGSLFSVLHSDKAIEWTLRFNIALDVAKGLSFLHHENILHRDIKSLNVLLDKHYQAKLTDFGLSKVKAETKSNTMASKTGKDSVGTIAWMAPELFRRKGVFTKKSDVYSLGITYWEIASRKIPFADAITPDLTPTWVKDGDREDIPADCPGAFGTLIEQCWEGEADSRPTADNIVERLKALAMMTATTTNAPVYRNNLASEAPVLRPVVFSAPSPVPRTASIPVVVNVPAQVVPVQQTPKLNVQSLNSFLRFVASGEQDQAEALLRANKDLALVTSDVTDLCNRTFKNITGFQYAIWALDWHMWKMIRQYLPDEEAYKQIQALETADWTRQHGSTASWQNLIDALQKFISLCNRSKWDETDAQWNKQVGGAQRLLPAHVVNEYCHPGRPFDPCPDFKQEGLPRSRSMDQKDWFTRGLDYGRMGEEFACSRGDMSNVLPYAGTFIVSVREDMRKVLLRNPQADLKACQALLVARRQQKDSLISEFKQNEQRFTQFKTN